MFVSGSNLKPPQTPPYPQDGSVTDERKEAVSKDATVFWDVVFFSLLICCQGQFCGRPELMRNGEKRQQNTLCQEGNCETRKRIKAAVKTLLLFVTLNNQTKTS